MIDNKTPSFNLPLPDPANKLSDDVLRLISALTQIDSLISTLGSSYSVHQNQASFPVSGVGGVMYIDQSTKSIFIWSGTAYVEISPFPGSSDAVSEGSTNLYFTPQRARASLNLALNVLQRNGTSLLIQIQGGVLQVVNRSGGTVSVSITQ